ncbi:hypothetical protein AB9F35_37430, partial [Rhizobium leguminosarum]
DVVFTWNGTTSGVRVPNADFIPDNLKGLTICDATSAAFAQALDFAKLDVAIKIDGGEIGKLTVTGFELAHILELQ